jgi:L-alanine-DL-glutamate epimerase-like enolase superfamily enzyme
MRLSDVEWLDYDTGKRRNGEPVYRCVLRVTSEQGERGWSLWRSTGLEERPHVEQLLAGADVCAHEEAWQLLYEAGISLPMVSAVDVALWDLHGRAEHKPVHALLGGTKRDSIRAYRSTHFNEGSPKDYAEDALRRREQGFHGYKIHPTHNDQWEPGKAEGDIETDIAIYRAVRDAVGADPGFVLMTDNYHTYDYEESVRVGRVLEGLGYLWYESPMFERAEDMENYVRLCSELEIPVCAPETNDGGHMSRLKWMEAGACDINRIDFWYGGITSCWIVAQACRKEGMPLDLHTGHYSHLQVMGATAEETIPYFEHYAVSDGVELRDDGRIPIPQTPGVGMEPDWDYVNANGVEL